MPTPFRRASVMLGCALLVAAGAVVTPVHAAHVMVARDITLPLPHLKLKRASPAPDTTLATAPDAVRLWLSEPADLVATRVTVKASNGVAITMRKPVQLPGRDAPIMTAFAAPLSPGRYTVNWKTMSKDGHVVSGQYDFTFAAH